MLPCVDVDFLCILSGVGCVCCRALPCDNDWEFLSILSGMGCVCVLPCDDVDFLVFSVWHRMCVLPCDNDGEFLSIVSSIWIRVLPCGDHGMPSTLSGVGSKNTRG